MTNDRNRAIEIIDSLKPHLTEKDYDALKSLSVVQVDTIAVPREVLQGVRENLELIANVYTNDRHIPADTEAANALHGSLSHCDDLARQALAALDAVLSEGE